MAVIDSARGRISSRAQDARAGTRLAIVTACILATSALYAACIVVVARGRIDSLFGLVPWLAAAAAVGGCLVVGLSAVVEATRRRLHNRRGRIAAARLVTLTAGSLEPSARARTVEWLFKRVDVTRETLVGVVTPELRAQLIAGGAANHAERELELSEDRWRRVNAAGVLGLLGASRSVGTLTQTLADPDRDVAYAAAQALSLYANPEAYGELLDALTGPAISPERVAGLLEAFSCPEARALIESRAAAEDPRIRYWVAYLLGRLADPRSAPAVLRLTRDPSEDVRANAAEALASFPDEAALRRLLADESWVVRAHAAKSAGVSGQTNLAGRLAELLEDRTWWVRQNATVALAAFGAEAVPALVKQLRSPDRFARNKAGEALVGSGYAAEQIARLSDADGVSDEARQFLVDLGRAEALGSIEAAGLAANPSARERLIGVLHAVGTGAAANAIDRIEGQVS
jgi:HEAT repeat protein